MQHAAHCASLAARARVVRCRHLCRRVTRHRGVAARERTSAKAKQPAGAEASVPTAWVNAAALVAGNTVGAGILALPVETAPAGVIPSLIAIGATWVYSVLTGQLLAEVSVAAQRDAAPGTVPSFVSLADRTLGKAGALASVALQFFLQYTLQVAYTARGGDVISRLLDVPAPLGAVVFTCTLAALCRVGDSKPAVLDAGNATLLAFLLVAFGALMTDVVPRVQEEALLSAHWSSVPQAIPVIALAFVYHNIVPITARSCDNNGAAIDRALIVGTGVPLAMYCLWECAVLGSSSVTSGVDPLANGGLFVDVFALCAVGTSYIGFTLSLVEMLLDTSAAAALKRALPEAPVRALALAAAAMPPCAAAILDPGIFVKALEVAGLYGALILCGVLPGAMALAQRREIGGKSTGYSAPGGDGAAIAVMVLGSAVVLGDAFGLFSQGQ